MTLRMSHRSVGLAAALVVVIVVLMVAVPIQANRDQNTLDASTERAYRYIHKRNPNGPFRYGHHDPSPKAGEKAYRHQNSKVGAKQIEAEELKKRGLPAAVGVLGGGVNGAAIAVGKSAAGGAAGAAAGVLNARSAAQANGGNGAVAGAQGGAAAGAAAGGAALGGANANGQGGAGNGAAANNGNVAGAGAANGANAAGNGLGGANNGAANGGLGGVGAAKAPFIRRSSRSSNDGSIVKVGDTELHIHVTQLSAPIPHAKALTQVEEHLKEVQSKGLKKVNSLLDDLDAHRLAKKPCLKKLTKKIEQLKSRFSDSEQQLAKIIHPYAYADNAPTLV